MQTKELFVADYDARNIRVVDLASRAVRTLVSTPYPATSIALVSERTRSPPPSPFLPLPSSPHSPLSLPRPLTFCSSSPTRILFSRATFPLCLNKLSDGERYCRQHALHRISGKSGQVQKEQSFPTSLPLCIHTTPVLHSLASISGFSSSALLATTEKETPSRASVQLNERLTGRQVLRVRTELRKREDVRASMRWGGRQHLRIGSLRAGGELEFVYRKPWGNLSMFVVAYGTIQLRRHSEGGGGHVLRMGGD
eukprot:481784-Hanusia_phi.AAC.2